jgi:hypothetical protein
MMTPVSHCYHRALESARPKAACDAHGIATERKVVTSMQEAVMRSDNGQSNINELHHMPVHGDVGDDTPLRLAVAAVTAFPDGSMTASGLHRECARGRLVIERIAGKDYTTLRAIGRMRELCRRHRNRHRNAATEREQTVSNVTKIADFSKGNGLRPSFGTRGSQVQILPLRPRLSSIRQLHPERSTEFFVP